MFQRTIIFIGIVGIVALNLSTSVIGKETSGEGVTYIRQFKDSNGTFVSEYLDAKGNKVYYTLDADGKGGNKGSLDASGKFIKESGKVIGYLDDGEYIREGSELHNELKALQKLKVKGTTWKRYLRAANGTVVSEYLDTNGNKKYRDASGNIGFLDPSGNFTILKAIPASSYNSTLKNLSEHQEKMRTSGSGTKRSLDADVKGGKVIGVFEGEPIREGSELHNELKELQKLKVKGKGTWRRYFRAANGIIVSEYQHEGYKEYLDASGNNGYLDANGKFRIITLKGGQPVPAKTNLRLQQEKMLDKGSIKVKEPLDASGRLRIPQKTNQKESVLDKFKRMMGLTKTPAKKNLWESMRQKSAAPSFGGSQASYKSLAEFFESKGIDFPGGWMKLSPQVRLALHQEYLGVGGSQGDDSTAEDSFRHDVFGPQGDETQEEWIDRLARNIWQYTYDKVLLKRAQDRAWRQSYGTGPSLINQAQQNKKWIAEKDEAEAKYAADSAAGLARAGRYYHQLLKHGSEQELIKQNLHRDGTARTAYGVAKRGKTFGPTLDYTKVNAEEARQRRQAAAFNQWLRDRTAASIAEREANRAQRAAEIEARNQEIKETRIARIRSEGGRDTGGGGGASVAWTDSEGNERRIETDGAGGRTETTVTGDGTTNVVESRADGVNIQTTTTGDNETTKVTTRTDEHGNTVETKELPDGTRVLTTTTTDPNTGKHVTEVERTVREGYWHVPGGGEESVWKETGKTVTERERVVSDRDGNIISTETTGFNGVTWNQDKDGNVTEVSGNSSTGGTTERTYDKNGTLTVVERDNNGKVTSQENFMFERTENKNGETELVVHNDDGFSTTYSQNPDGSLKFKDSTRQEREDRGRDLYLEQKADLELSSNWDDLSESAKQEYNRERDRRNVVAERRDREDQQRRDLEASRLAAKNKREEQGRQDRLEREQNQRETDEKLAKIEQERQEHMRRYEDLMDGPEHEGQQNIADSTPENIDKKVENSVTQQTSGVANTRDRPSGNAVETDETQTPKPKGLNLLGIGSGEREAKSGDEGISVSEFQEKWTGRGMRAEDGEMADSNDPGKLAGWKATRVILSNVEDEVYDVGATVIKAPLDVVTAIYGVPGGRVGAVIKNAFGELVTSKGDVYTAAVNTVIDQIVVVGIKRTKNKFFGEATDLGTVADAAMATDGVHPLEGGTALQNFGKGIVEYVQGVSIKQERETVVFTKNQILSDTRNNYAVDTIKTTVYDENTGKGVIIIETVSQKALEVENTGFFITKLEPKKRFGRKSNHTIVIPFTGKGEDARLGNPRMLTPREEKKMQQQHSR